MATCVVLKTLNLVLKRKHYILPILNDIASKLSRVAVFSKLDATSFCQIHLEKESYLTTFITRFEQHYFKQFLLEYHPRLKSPPYCRS